MRKMIKNIAVVSMMLVAGYSISTSAAGTTSGTALTATATVSASGGVTTVTAATSTTVTSVYGLATSTFDEASAADKSVSAGSFATYTVSIQNNGNISDTIGINLGAQIFDGGSGTTTDWGVAVDDAVVYAVGLDWNVSGNATASQAGDATASVSAVGPGAYATYTVRVRTAADATDGASMAVQLSFVTASTPVGSYNGYNGNPYGGDATVLRTVGGGVAGVSYITTTVNAAVLTVAKSASVTAPAVYIGNGGGATDPVPGAKITYTITYGNTGGGAASSVVIVDPIPANTTYLAGSILLNAVGNTDAVGGDECDYNGSNALSVTCNIASLGGGTINQTLVYVVTID